MSIISYYHYLMVLNDKQKKASDKQLYADYKVYRERFKDNLRRQSPILARIEKGG